MFKKRELQDFRSALHNLNKTVILDGPIDVFESLINQPDKICQFERPDMFFIQDDSIIGIEQFEFDSGVITKKGSKSKCEFVNENRRLDTTMHSYDNNGACQFRGHVDLHLSYENYLNSLKTVFDRHYRNIDIYIQNLSKIDNKQVHMYFYIYDSTPMGNYIITKKGIIPMTPILCGEFVQYLREKVKLAGIIFNYEYMVIRYLSFFQITQQNLNIAYENRYLPSEEIFLKHDDDFIVRYYKM